MAKAYSTVYDKHANHPKKNLVDVVRERLAENENVKHLIIQGGSVDITNLNTKDNTYENMEQNQALLKN